jgi:hypothetical protein
MAKPKNKTVRVYVDVELRGSAVVEMPEDEVEKLIDKMDGQLGSVHVDELPFSINWDDVINTSEPTVEDIYIKADR